MKIYSFIRNWLLAGLAGCTSIPFEGQNVSQEDFDNSPFISVTGVYGASSSRYTLVHVRQMHPINSELEKKHPLIKEEKEAMYGIVNAVQKDIYFFLDDTMKHKGLSQLWTEGVTEEQKDEQARRNYAKYCYLQVMAVLDKQGLFSEEMATKNFQRCKYVPGAEMLLAWEGRLNLLPAETFELNERAVLSQLSRSGIPTNVYKTREDYLIQEVVKRGAKTNMVLYGAGHDFSDNVQAWNVAHPEQSIRLIELTPKSLERILTSR